MHKIVRLRILHRPGIAKASHWYLRTAPGKNGARMIISSPRARWPLFFIAFLFSIGLVVGVYKVWLESYVWFFCQGVTFNWLHGCPQSHSKADLSMSSNKWDSQSVKGPIICLPGFFCLLSVPCYYPVRIVLGLFRIFVFGSQVLFRISQQYGLGLPFRTLYNQAYNWEFSIKCT